MKMLGHDGRLGKLKAVAPVDCFLVVSFAYAKVLKMAVPVFHHHALAW